MESYEKKYKEAQKWIESIYPNLSHEQQMEAEAFFPELKEESEDERIRKELIDIVAKSPITFAFEDKNKVLSWLERQGEQTDKIVERAKTEKQRVLITESDGEANIDWDTRSLQDVKLLLEYGLDYVNKLEKQGGEKPRYSIGDVLCDKSCTTLNKESQPNFEITDIRNGMYICNKCSFPISQQDEYELVAKRIEQKPTFEMKTPEESLGIDSETYNEIVDECIYGEQKSQRMISAEAKEAMYDKPADKVEPKFKVGEWITHNTANFVFKIINVGSNGYEVVNRENYKKTISFDNEDNYHLWTIQDAKDGDVLLFEGYYNSIVLFQGIGINGKGRINYHCKCDLGNYSFGVQNDVACLGTIEKDSEHYHPATKEHRELLFKKMHEAGYTFDFDKKELKKIEQKPATMSIDEAIEHCKEKSCGNNACALEHKQLEKWLTELKELKEQKPAWSEEDEVKLQTCIDRLQAESLMGKVDTVMTNWLKSLKERINGKQ